MIRQTEKSLFPYKGHEMFSQRVSRVSDQELASFHQAETHIEHSSLPNASLHKTALTAESTPPDKPKTTLEQPEFST